jgi:ribosomal protein S18 acetylase RimI-like enzyme
MTEMERSRVQIERLAAGDGLRLRSIRLRALRDAPDAFASTFAEAAARSPEGWEQQVVELATFVAVLEGHDVGMARGATLEDAITGLLISVWVAPEARGLGIGEALVDAVVAWARASRLERLLVDVGDENAAAIALYARMGFEPTGEVGTLPPPREHIREHRRMRTL